MSPRTGRPPKGESSKKESLQLRLSKKTMQELEECSEEMKISRTEVIEKAIEKIHSEVVRKK